MPINLTCTCMTEYEALQPGELSLEKQLATSMTGNEFKE